MTQRTKTNWQRKRLGEVCEIGAGNSAPQKKEMFTNGVYPFFRTSDVGKIHLGFIKNSVDKLNDLGRKKLKFYRKGTLLFPKSGASTFLNHRVIMGVDGYVSSHLATLKAKSNILDDHFLFYFSMIVDSRNLMQDQNYPSLRLSDIQGIEIFFPPIPQQKRIVKVLDEVFEKVAKSKENAEKNLRNSRELFESYLQSVFANPSKDWKERKLGEVAEVFGGFAFKSNEFTKAGKYQVLRMGNVRPGLIRIDESPVFIDKINKKTLSRSLLRRGDIIITQTGTRKKRDYGYTVAIDKDNYLLNQRLAAIRFSGKFNYKFFLYFSWSDKFRDQFFANETGTVGQGNVGIGAVTGALVPVPRIVEQKRIIIKLDTLFTETKKLKVIYQQKLADLEELKKSILKKAFNGEL